MNTKLQLNKRTVTELSNSELDSVKGGFTYSLSLSSTCQHSKALGGVNRKDCLERVDRMNDGVEDPSVQ